MIANTLIEQGSVVATTRSFWSYIDRLVADSKIVIDRPRGSPHPRYPNLVYPLDCGYLEGTRTVDGGGIEVWLGAAQIPKADTIAVSIDLEKRDAEIKILLGCSPGEERQVQEFLNREAMRAIFIRRNFDALNLLESRCSVRSFKPDPVPENILERVLQAATWAPSAHNRQPWRFAVLNSMNSRATMVEEMGAEFIRDLVFDGVNASEATDRLDRSRKRIMQAPVAILICLDIAELDKYPDDARQQAELLMGVQSVAMAGENLLLAAHALGLGGVWVCAPLFAPVVVRHALNIPTGWQPQGLILLGYPAKMPDSRPRWSVRDVTRYY
jgi:F420 biosynthesis protein FbiB-like protein